MGIEELTNSNYHASFAGSWRRTILRRQGDKAFANDDTVQNRHCLLVLCRPHNFKLLLSFLIYTSTIHKLCARVTVTCLYILTKAWRVRASWNDHASCGNGMPEGSKSHLRRPIEPASPCSSRQRSFLYYLAPKYTVESTIETRDPTSNVFHLEASGSPRPRRMALPSAYV